MTLILKQSTSVDIRIGPFVDATDAVTPETGITLAAADQAEVLKANGVATVAMGTGSPEPFVAVTGADGWYDYTVQTGDVDTVGEVVFVVQDASVCLPVFVRGYVVEEAVFDAMYGAAAAGPLQATTAGRTLDIATTGEVALDFGSTIGTLDAGQFGADFITSAKIADSAFLAVNFAAASLNGKGDWNIGKTGYSLTQSFPTNFSAQSITAGGLVDITQAAADKVFGASGAVLPELAVGIPAATPTPREYAMLLYMAIRNKLDVTTAIKRVHNDAGTIVTTKALTDDGSTYSEAEMISG